MRTKINQVIYFLLGPSKHHSICGQKSPRVLQTVSLLGGGIMPLLINTLAVTICPGTLKARIPAGNSVDDL